VSITLTGDALIAQSDRNGQYPLLPDITHYRRNVYKKTSGTNSKTQYLSSWGSVWIVGPVYNEARGGILARRMEHCPEDVPADAWRYLKGGSVGGVWTAGGIDVSCV
jgi:hypothetical protein